MATATLTNNVIFTPDDFKTRWEKWNAEREAEREKVWYDLSGISPKSCIRFINIYCKTLNPDLDPPETDFVLYKYQEDYIKNLFVILDEKKFAHVDKTRQMGLSWTTMGFQLYGLMFIPGFSSLTLSRKEKDVDDGGMGNTVDSLFGRVRFMYERLPGWMQKRAGASFSKIRITCECNPSAYLVGEGATPDAARHGSYMFSLWDEMVRTPFSKTIAAGWRRSVRSGVYLSTPQGKNNEFGRLKKSESSKMIHLSYHWKLHPEYGRKAYKDEDGRLRSPWFDLESQDMLDEEIASELEISYEGSVAGIIYKEWDSDFIIAPDIPYDLSLSLSMDWDFGIGDDTAVVISQRHGSEERILRAYSGNNLLPYQHFAKLKSILNDIGFIQDYGSIEHYADPSGLSRNIASGNSVIHEYESLFAEEAGSGVYIQFNTPRYGIEDGIRVGRRRLKAGKIRVSERATVFVDAIEAYQRKTDRQGNIPPEASPKHDWASHVMDAWRYGEVGRFGIKSERVVEAPFIMETAFPRTNWRFNPGM